jgi:hypothetical protein
MFYVLYPFVTDLLTLPRMYVTVHTSERYASEGLPIVINFIANH